MTFGLQFEDLTEKILLSVMLFVLDIMVLVFGAITTRIDPSDMTVRLEKYFRMTNQKFDDSNYEFNCNHCDTNVK